MRATVRLVVVVLVVVGCWIPHDASAEQVCRNTRVSFFKQGKLHFKWVRMCHEVENSPTGSTGPAGEPDLPDAGSAACVGGAIQLGLDPIAICGSPPPLDSPVVTTDLVARAFHRLPLPASGLGIQPPGGRTLVNFETNFFTTDGQPFTRTLRLLGQRVELRIWAESWTWHYGDGESETTTSPGARFPDLEITHRYLAKQTYQPRVDTTYAAEWRVGGEPWRPVTGTATIAGAPVGLRAIEARPTLVGHDG